jgi:hypothetical protein
MKIVADMEDAHYYEMRSCELLREANDLRRMNPGSFIGTPTAVKTKVTMRYHKLMNKAIQLIALARIVA